MRSTGQLRRALAALILASAVLFAIGSAIERHTGNEKGEHSAAAEHSGSESSGESGEEGHHPEGGGAAEQGGATRESHKESSEDILGIDPEATGLVVAAIAVGVLLALAVWFLDSGLVLLAVVGFGLVFAVFDVREVVHQLDESHAGLVAIAAVLAVLHLGIAALAGAGMRPAPAMNA
jgi:hypothetical protein